MEVRANPRFALALATTLWAVTLGAQQAPEQAAGDTEPVETLPRYYVEVLVFSNEDGATSTSESFTPRSNPLSEPLAPETEGLVPDPIPEDADQPAPLALSAGTARLDADPEAQVDGLPDAAEDTLEDEFRFELLEVENLSLNDARDNLERLAAYTPLFHGGWVQEGYPEERAKPFDIALIDSTTPVAGTLTLHRSRFLHIRVDLEYLPPEVPESAASAPGSLAEPLLSSLPMDTEGPRFQIAEARRLRSGELHFFDHPAFGVLVQITPEPLPDVTELDLTTLPQRRTPLPSTTDQSS
jgi:hypothetical protein